MKNSVLILLLVSLCCTRDDLQNEKYDQLECDQLINEPYNFPVKPGDPEWSEFETEEERFKEVSNPNNFLMLY